MQLKNYPIWLVWKKELVETPGSEGLKSQRFTKIPYQINGYKASSVNPSHWVTYEQARKAYESNKQFSGIGFVISREFPLLCLDFDHCIKDNEIVRDDLFVVQEAANTYTELSPSGDGLHIIFELEKHFPLIANKKVNDDGTAVEAYTENRYFTFTGNPFKNEDLPVRKISQEEGEEIIRMLGYPWGQKDEQIKQIDATKLEYTMPNDILLKKMFKAKGGTKLKKLYDGDISEYNNDGSSADAALCTALAFWTAKNAHQMEEIWLASPLGQREKTQTRKDYRDRTIANVIPLVSSVYSENVSGKIIKDSAKIKPVLLQEIVFDGENNTQGIPHKNIPNIKQILAADSYLAKAFRFNTFSDMIECNIENGKDWVPLETRHVIIVSEYIQTTYKYFENLAKQTVEEAIILHSMSTKVNPPQDLIKSVVWDKVNRIDTWLMTVFNAPDTTLNRSISSNWMKGLVNRVCTPGCQFDTVLVLEGGQGIGKSSVLRALAMPWYAETTMDIDTKDFQLILTQNILVEFSEGASLSRSEAKSLKQKITEREDNFRRPYEKSPQKFPRRCVFAMTTNEEQYLKDTTGNRRWLPIALPNTKADVEWVFENRLQLFAEAYHRVYELKETTYEFPQEELLLAQSSRMEEDPWVSAIVNWYFDELSDQERADGVTTVEAHTKALWDISRKDFGNGQSQRVASLFRNELFLKKVKYSEKGQSAWRYFATPATDDLNNKRNLNMTETEKAKKAQIAARQNQRTTYQSYSVPVKPMKDPDDF
jgi:predicted P-loop ATPase